MLKLEERELTGSVKDLSELSFMNVSGTEDEPLWDEMIRKYHYLGLGRMIGPRIKYLVMHGGAAIAALGFDRASKSIGVREEYIGWGYQQRTLLLKHVVKNTRFLIMPGIRVKNLASHLLARGVKEMRADWAARYGETPCVVETFVDGDLYKGTCYVAANWRYLGETRGFRKEGKAFVYHGHRKKVFVYVLDKKFIGKIRKESGSGAAGNNPKRPTPKQTARRDCQMMIETTSDWSPRLLKDAGITEDSVAGLGKELTKYMGSFDACFARSEGRENSLLVIKGLLSDLERKSIEPIALRYASPEKVRALQVFMGAPNAADDDALLAGCQKRLAGLISDDDGMANVDGSDFAKKGKKSVGVSRQHCGSLGKVENCQAGVFVGYSSSKGYGLVDRRLYMPKSWMGDENKDRRKECHVPEDLEFKTKIELASEMIDDMAGSGLFKIKWVGADSFFGRNKSFLDGLPDGVLYFADILFNMKVYPMGDATGSAAPEPVSVAARDVAADEAIPWSRIVLAEGSKGPIIADEKCVRVYENRDGKPCDDVWLYIRRFTDGKLKYALSDAPADMPIAELRQAATMRWPIEQCFEECKSDLGMDHYEGRSWTLWHRHMLFVFIAHLFLLEVRLMFKKNTNSDLGAGERAGAGSHSQDKSGDQSRDKEG
jgi:SRSO17 transposase